MQEWEQHYYYPLVHEVWALAIEAGVGHKTAAKNIERYLKLDREFRAITIEKGMPGFIDWFYENVLRRLPSKHSGTYDFSNRHPELLELLYKGLAPCARSRIRGVEQAEVAIVTHPFLIPCLEQYGYQGKIVVVGIEVVDNHRAYFRKKRGRFADKYFVISQKAKQQAMGYGVPDDRIVVTGPFVHPTCFDREKWNLSPQEGRREFNRLLKISTENRLQNEFELPENEMCLALSSGGGRSWKSSLNDVERVCQIVQQLRREDKKVNISLACGRNQESFEFYQNLREKYDFLYPYQWLSWDNGEMAAYLMASDLRLCPGISALMVNENWVAKRPTISWELQAQERQHEEFLRENGIGIALGSADKLEEQLRQFVDDPLGWTLIYAPRVREGLPKSMSDSPQRVREAIGELVL